jgi:hypothetical protein
MGAPDVSKQAGMQPPPPPAPTRGEYERMVKAEAEAYRRDREQMVGKPLPHQVPVDPAIDFMARIENAAALLTDVGSELGNVGQEDATALRSFANTLQQNVQRYVSQLVERKRRELADLERILGKF